MQRARHADSESPATDDASRASRPRSFPAANGAPPGERRGSAAQAINAMDAETRRGLCRLAHRFLWNAEDAEDVVHDAIIHAGERADQLRSADAWLPWLKRIVVHRCLDARRRRAVAQRGLLRIAAEEESAPPGPDAKALAAEQRTALVEAIGRLPEKQQSVLVLRELEQMPYREIAELLEMNESTVRVQARNARESLRAMLRPDPEEAPREAR
jgi:RNA polymerase sigma-70 factor (ECF subfamily)